MFKLIREMRKTRKPSRPGRWDLPLQEFRMLAVLSVPYSRFPNLVVGCNFLAQAGGSNLGGVAI
jgi:hypothetical protein